MLPGTIVTHMWWNILVLSLLRGLFLNKDLGIRNVMLVHIICTNEEPKTHKRQNEHQEAVGWNSESSAELCSLALFRSAHLRLRQPMGVAPSKTHMQSRCPYHSCWIHILWPNSQAKANGTLCFCCSESLLNSSFSKNNETPLKQIQIFCNYWVFWVANFQQDVKERIFWIPRTNPIEPLVKKW